MRSIGIDLGRWLKNGRLQFHSVRPSLYGLEMHLALLHKRINAFKPDAAAFDPVSNMLSISTEDEAKSMLSRLIDFMKNMGITSVFTSLTAGGDALEKSEVGISSVMDTWVLVRMIETSGERNRLIYVLKSRGMAHSNQMREFHLTNDGIQLMDVYTGPGEVLTGSVRLMQEARDRAQAVADRQAEARRQLELEQEQANLRNQTEVIARRIAEIGSELLAGREHGAERQQVAARDRQALAQARKADPRKD
jgi:circadian clock protein KaiC